MEVRAVYSHLNGQEILTVHQPDILEEVRELVDEVNAEKHRNKVSRETTKTC